MTCPECNVRPVRTRGRCGTCYKRHLRHGTHLALPLSQQKGRPRKHHPDDCPVCEEVEQLHAWGLPGDQIAEALGMTPEAVHVHVRRYSPHLMHITIYASNQYIRERTRKATA